MIKKETRDKLLGIIKEKMIPERIEMLKSLEELKKAYVEYVEKNYMTERDLELIKKFPSCVKQVDQIPVAHYYNSVIELVYFNGYYNTNDLCIKFDHPLPSIADSIVELKDNNEAWKSIGPPFYRYLNLRNRYVKKLNIANEFLSHKNTTITLIKTKFSELYELYRTND